MALAGILQAIKLVQQTARKGMLDQEVFETCIKSILRLDASSPEAVYGSSDRLMEGCKELLNQLGAGSEHSKKSRDFEITKYVVSIMLLERKLVKRGDLLERIKSGIEKANAQVEHFSLTHENVIANLADLYSETISTLKPRIMVDGEHHLLTVQENANKIRALLLAAVRSAVLWRQCGGSRWHMLFKRDQLIREAELILQDSQPRSLH